MQKEDFEMRFEPVKNMTPIAHAFGNEKELLEARYEISVSEQGEPYLSIDTEGRPESMFRPADRRVLREIGRLSKQSSIFEINFSPSEVKNVLIHDYPFLLDMLPRTARITGPDNEQVHFSDSFARLLLNLEAAPEGNLVVPCLTLVSGQKTWNDITFLSENYVLAGNRIFTVAQVGNNFPHISSILSPFPAEQITLFVSLFMSYFDNITPVYKGKEARFSQNPELAVPTVVLEKVAQDQALYMRLVATVESMNEDAMENLTLTRSASINEEGVITIRDIRQPDLSAAEENLTKIILSSSPSRKARKDVYCENRFFIIPSETASPFLLHHLADVLREFRLIGSGKLKEYKISAVPPKLKLNLSSGIDFLEGSAEIELGPDKFSIADLLNQYAQNRYVVLSDGNRAIIDARYIARLQRIFRTKKKGDKVKISFFDLPEVEKLINDKLQGKFAAGVREVYEGFNKLREAKDAPVKVNATLRDYQKQGVKWLKYLYDNNLGGCLADDMGLGKTLQTISLLSLLYPGCGKPSIIIMPRSLLFNWEKEFEKFAPGIKVKTYYGADRNLTDMSQADVIITTYAVARNEIERLKEVEFEYAILDESQNIKNVSSQTSQAVTLLNARHRLALSGTPMENNLTELYSLFRFLNPTMFGQFEDFNNRYTYPIQKGGDADASEALRRKIFPFILRRLKRDVLTELPERIDRTLYVEMSDSQRKLYEDRRLAFREEIEKTIRTQGVAKSQFVMFQALNELRRIASVPESLTEGRISSPKIEELIENLIDTVGNDHKCVVFFNYIVGLEIVATRLNMAGIEFETMTGSTSASARKRIVERFQTDSACKVLLMTLKVGGVGLNLTAADTVFIFEPWWNKAAEEQAINRLHRIGQKAVVVSNSFITLDTIEEKILKLQQQKSELFDALISDDSTMGKQLSEEDIKFILS
ncbi:MAG: DEAD/DEAH box helicase [Bacteroides sp.]|nr:DEAD/DEAH box helicase [Bacteroides sp.]